MSIFSKKFSRTWKNKSEEKHQSLSEIFKDDGKKTDFKSLTPPKKKRRLFLWLSLAFVVMVGVLSLLGFYFFSKEGPKFSGKSLKLEVQAPANISSGGNILLILKYQNQERVALQKVNLTLRYPDGFDYLSAKPEAKNEFKNVWELGTIETGATGQVEISGKLTGEVGTVKNFNFSLHYFPANFNSEFSQEISFEVTLTTSILDLAILGPDKTISGEEVDYKIKYKNQAKTPLENFRLVILYPVDFELKEAKPEPKEETTWFVKKMESQEEGEITLKGIMKGEPGEQKELKVEMFLKDEENNYNRQTSASHLTLMVNPGLKLTLKINGAEREEAANLGDTLNYGITFENNGEIEIKDLVLEAELEGQILDWESLEDENEGVVQEIENKITWDKTKISDLEELNPGETGKFDFQINLLPSLSIKDESDKNFQVKSKVTTKSLNLGSLESSGFKSESNEVLIKINTKLNLLAEGRYFSEEYEPLGSGPLPPEVGKMTTYRIYWYLSNTTNTVSDIKVKTTLPERVFWSGRSDVMLGQNLKFNAQSREVVWEINQISPQAGFTLPSPTAWFEVSITPKSNEVGEFLTLTGKTALAAQDAFTGTSISVSDSEITTDLENDVAAQGKGKVVPANSSENSNVNAE